MNIIILKSFIFCSNYKHNSLFILFFYEKQFKPHLIYFTISPYLNYHQLFTHISIQPPNNQQSSVKLVSFIKHHYSPSNSFSYPSIIIHCMRNPLLIPSLIPIHFQFHSYLSLSISLQMEQTTSESGTYQLYSPFYNSQYSSHSKMNT